MRWPQSALGTKFNQFNRPSVNFLAHLYLNDLQVLNYRVVELEQTKPTGLILLGLVEVCTEFIVK